MGGFKGSVQYAIKREAICVADSASGEWTLKPLLLSTLLLLSEPVHLILSRHQLKKEALATH